MKTIRALIVLVIVAVGAAVAYAYSGWYDVSVGTGHNAVTAWYLETLRERSIATRAADIRVPALDDPAMIQSGAMRYEDGCAGCHGKPGQDAADIFEPGPPSLTRHAEEPAEAYWVIQNGIKMSAMPIKGRGLSEEEVWSIVAFLQELPGLTRDEYQEMVEAARAESGQAEDEDRDAPSAGGESPQAAVEAFHQALFAGDRDGVLALLHDNATIVEGGQLWTKSQYAAEHLDGDLEFLSGATLEPVSRDVSAGDNQATVTSRATITATVDGREEVHEVAETVSLIRTEAGWRITHVNWASADTGEDSEATGSPASDGDTGD